MAPRLRRVTPTVPAREMAASVEWYRDQLGFEVLHVEDGYGVIGRDDVFVHFWGPSGIDPKKSDTMIRIEVDDIVTLYEQCRERKIVHPNAPLTDQPWGATEFAVLDNDGNLVTFNSPTIVVRPAVQSDSAALGRVHVEAWRAAYAGVIPAHHLAGLDAEARAEQWSDSLGRDQSMTAVVAEVEGEVLGMAGFGPARAAEGVTAEAAPTEGELWMMNVEPAAWGRGIGRALLAAATDGLREQGHPEAILWVVEANPRARQLYERGGWTLDGGRQSESIGGAEIAELRYRITLVDPT